MRSLVLLCTSTVGIFAAFCLATAWRASLPDLLPGDAGYALCLMCLVYYFVRGYLVTSIYVYVKKTFPKHEAERLSSNLGFLGQLGALSSNTLMFFVVQGNLIGAPGKGP